jgi:hypothetical protein
MGRYHDRKDIDCIVDVQAKLDEMAGRGASSVQGLSLGRLGKYVHQEAVDVVCLTFMVLSMARSFYAALH